MSQKQKRDGIYIAVSSLKNIIVGEQSCEWASWFKANFRDFEQAPSDFDGVSWKIKHTRLLRDIRIERSGLGESVTVERQNRFNYRTTSGATIGGTPDLIATTADQKHATVYDAKTGKQRDSDSAQVMLYMHLLPLALPAYRKMKVSGVVVYRDHRVAIPASAVDPDFVRSFNDWVGTLESSTPAQKVPSHSECRFCSIAKSECPERIEGSA